MEAMERQTLAAIAEETLAILARGEFVSPKGRTISIQQAITRACDNTHLYLPDDYPLLLSQSATWRRFPTSKVTVANRTTLAAGRALAEEFPSLGCLNFASAKRPGGGFLNGSSAQEESLARSSAIYPTLQTQPDFYAYHRRQGSAFYSNRLIFSPAVPVFRDDDGALLEKVWAVSFLTAAAVNAGAVSGRGKNQMARIAAAMAERVRMVLAVAAHHRCDALVLGAWGCGVFRNDPQQIAAIFAQTLADPLFSNRFQHIEFAVFDPTPTRRYITPFETAFR